MIRRATVRTAAVSLLIAALAGCSGSSAAHAVLTVSSEGLRVEPQILRGGLVRFDIDNGSGVERDLVILPMMDPTTVPLDPDGGIDIARTGLADRVDHFAAGHFRFLAPHLPAGEYLLASQRIDRDPAGKIIRRYEPSFSTRIEVQPSSLVNAGD